jgi:hypothetical protein
MLDTKEVFQISVEPEAPSIKEEGLKEIYHYMGLPRERSISRA